MNNLKSGWVKDNKLFTHEQFCEKKEKTAVIYSQSQHEQGLVFGCLSLSLITNKRFDAALCTIKRGH